jgi:cytochrome c oxidase cbb3-type subunit 3
MQKLIWIAVTLLAAFGAASCGSQSTTTVAAAGGAPALGTIPVGPIPGPPANLAFPTNPFGGSDIGRMQGRQLFIKYNCYGCHGGHAGGGMGPSLRDAAWLYGSSDANIFASISQGRGAGMPTWGTMLPQEQIWKLVAYIKSLRTPLEPEPPQ